MDSLDLFGKLMFGLGVVIGGYTLIYGFLIWLGYFADRPASSADHEDREPTE